MEGRFDKNLMNYIVEQVCKHKGYAQVIQCLKDVDYNDDLSICYYCELPHNGHPCGRCENSWCGRDFYCQYPKEGIGVCINKCSDLCIRCTKCKVENCEGTVSSYGCKNCCENSYCIVCDGTFCPNHRNKYTDKCFNCSPQ
jgi:hypothetical protein